MYAPKPGKSVLLISTEHEDPEDQEFPEPHKKNLILVDFYNSQRCGLDIANEMLKDYSF